MENISEKLCRIVRDKLNCNDKFCRELGIALTVNHPGYAEAEMPIAERHCNSVGVVQGGAIFTLADFAFAGAGNSWNKITVSEVCELHFLRPGTGSRLRAVAREINRSQRNSLCSVEVFDDRGKLVACGTVKGCILPQPFINDADK